VLAHQDEFRVVAHDEVDFLLQKAVGAYQELLRRDDVSLEVKQIDCVWESVDFDPGVALPQLIRNLRLVELC